MCINWCKSLSIKASAKCPDCHLQVLSEVFCSTYENYSSDFEFGPICPFLCLAQTNLRIGRISLLQIDVEVKEPETSKNPSQSVEIHHIVWSRTQLLAVRIYMIWYRYLCIIWYYLDIELQNIYRTRPKAVCASPLRYIHCKKRMAPWPLAAQGHNPTLLLDTPLSSSFALKLQTPKQRAWGKLNVRLARSGWNPLWKVCLRCGDKSVVYKRRYIVISLITAKSSTINHIVKVVHYCICVYCFIISQKNNRTKFFI